MPEETKPAETTAETVAPQPEQIAKQIDFYFGDSNLPRDKFLKEKVSSDADGYVDIDIICSFKRMKQFGATVENAAEAIKNSEIVEVSEDGKRVRRREPLPEHDTSASRTVYAKGFAKDTTTIESIEKIFATFGTVKAVRLRRFYKTREFKGSAFIEFADEAEVAKAVAANNKPESTDGVDLIIKTKSDYFTGKKAEREERAKKAKEDAAPEFKWEKGCLIAVKNIGAGVSREDIKALVSPHGDVSFIEFKREDVTATIRMANPEGGSKALAALLEAKPKLGDKEIEVSAVDGEEEETYWAKIKELMQRKNEGGGQKRKGGWKGRGANAKRQR